MISHFQYKPLHVNDQLPGWIFSFFFKGQAYNGVYQKDGRIEWKNNVPTEQDIDKLTSHIHELMLFHVYE
jgi:hypothetical protein